MEHRRLEVLKTSSHDGCLLLMYVFIQQKDDEQQNDSCLPYLRAPRTMQRVFASEPSEHQVRKRRIGLTERAERIPSSRINKNVKKCRTFYFVDFLVLYWHCSFHEELLTSPKRGFRLLKCSSQ